MLADFTQIARRRVAILHHTGATNHFQISHLGQSGQDFVLHAVSKECVLLVVAQIFKWQHRDALFRNDGRSRGRTGGGPRARFLQNRRRKNERHDYDSEDEKRYYQDRNPRTLPTVWERSDFFFVSLDFLWWGWVANNICVKIYDPNYLTVLDLHIPEIVQIGLPPARLGQIIRHPFGNKDVPGVSAIHDSLGDIDPSPGNVFALVDVGHVVDWSAVNSHPHRQAGFCT